ncbi:MAG: prepilin-type N-terminal cleavage/methylation domain-containing protein [Acidobacteria bacterium]|nr:prepilin-type N-terminal cleavage/methylation domain-containing protein [Acidobacteriota bacterium]
MLQRLKGSRDERGFTLIELLIVIVILGILAAVVVFAVGGITSRGANAACKSDFKSVEVAQEASKAQSGSYKADVAALVTANFLRSAPPDTEPEAAANGYWITTDTSGVVTVHNNNGTVGTLTDDTTSTDASNCPT